MADQDLYAQVKEFFQNIFGNESVAAQVAADPQGALAAHGITEYDDEVYRQAVADTYQEYDLPYGDKEALAGYVQGGPAPANYPVQAPSYAGGQAAGQYAPAGAEAVQHVQYVTYAAYEEDPQIQQEITNNSFQFLSVDQSDNRQFEVDNSVNLDDVNVQGDLDLDIENANALGDDSIAVTGEDNQVDVGDGDRITVEDNEGTVLVGSEVDGDVLTATDGGEVTNVEGDGAFVAEDVEGSVNTGTFTGVQAGDDVENAVVGNDNQTANLEFDTGGGSGGIADGGDGGAGGPGGTAGPRFGDQSGGFNDADGGTGGPGGDADASGGAGGDIGPVNLNFGGGDQSNFADSEVLVEDGAAFSLEGDSTGINTDDSFNTELDQQINQGTEIQEAQLQDAQLAQEVPVAEDLPEAGEAAAEEIPIA